MRYRKKPIVIEAEQWHIARTNWAPEGMPSHPFVSRRPFRRGWWAATANGWSRTQPGDYIVSELDGIHHYPVKPDLFEATYELVEEPPTADG